MTLVFERPPPWRKNISTILSIELSEEQAEALAQFCKRSTFDTFRDRAQTEDEAYLMRDAMAVIQRQLNEAGYGPR